MILTKNPANVVKNSSRSIVWGLLRPFRYGGNFHIALTDELITN